MTKVTGDQEMDSDTLEKVSWLVLCLNGKPSLDGIVIFMVASSSIEEDSHHQVLDGRGL